MVLKRQIQSIVLQKHNQDGTKIYIIGISEEEHCINLNNSPELFLEPT
jgi:hypothetical protein